jgi:hypothetical protein
MFRSRLSTRCAIPGWLGILAIGLLAADPSWKIKPPAQWNEEDATQVLTASPWAREITAVIARRQSEDELRAGGHMGQPHAIGYDDVDPKGAGPKLPTSLKDVVTPEPNGGKAGSQVPGIPLRLRWESAFPVRIAELKARQIEPPTLEGEGYRIAVYGLPGGYFKGDPKKLGEPLKEFAFLKREGKKDVKPSIVEVFPQSDGWAVVYLFPLSAEISPQDKQVEFDASIGRIVLAQRFDLRLMLFQGKLEI